MIDITSELVSLDVLIMLLMSVMLVMCYMIMLMVLVIMLLVDMSFVRTMTGMIMLLW